MATALTQASLQTRSGFLLEKHPKIDLSFSGFTVVAPNIIDVSVRNDLRLRPFSDNTTKAMHIQLVNTRWEIIQERSTNG